MMVGFFMSTIILTALGKLIGEGFQVFTAGLRTGTLGFGGLITLFALTFLIGGVILTACHRLFGLITWIPDNVMKWIGHSPHALGEGEAESKIRAAFGGFVSGAQNAMNPRKTAALKGLQGKGKGKGDGDANLATTPTTPTTPSPGGNDKAPPGGDTSNY